MKEMGVAAEMGRMNAVTNAVFQLVRETLSDSLNERSVVDYDDQIYHPVVCQYKLDRHYDYIFVDEGQDLTPAQHKLLVLLANTSTRICVVGDPAQAIYQFRGADEDSMSRLQDTLSAREIQLNTSFRCSVAITRLVQLLVPNFCCCPQTAQHGTCTIRSCKMADVCAILQPHDIGRHTGTKKNVPLSSQSEQPSIDAMYGRMRHARTHKPLLGQGL